jgi:hypothetical protein
MSETVKIRVYETISLLVWYMGVKLTMSDEHGLVVFQNRALMRLFVPTREEVTGNRSLHSGALHGLYCFSRIRMR